MGLIGRHSCPVFRLGNEGIVAQCFLFFNDGISGLTSGLLGCTAAVEVPDLQVPHLPLWAFHTMTCYTRAQMEAAHCLREVLTIREDVQGAVAEAVGSALLDSLLVRWIFCIMPFIRANMGGRNMRKVD